MPRHGKATNDEFGFRLEGAPVFSVQYHPEASPGPMDSHYLFDRFATAAKARV